MTSPAGSMLATARMAPDGFENEPLNFVSLQPQASGERRTGWGI